jgi:copper chaperone
MTCDHCKSSIESALGGIDGVSAVSVDLESKRVQVAFDDTRTEIARIISAIQDQGFDVDTV